MTGPRPGPLFGGRARKAPPATEFRTHVALADLLRLAIAPGWWWSHIPSGEKRDEATGARLKRLGLQPGMADFLLLGSPGVCFLELKRPPNKLSEAQQAFRAAAIAAGAQFEVAYSYNEAEAALKRWGCLRVVI